MIIKGPSPSGRGPHLQAGIGERCRGGGMGNWLINDELMTEILHVQEGISTSTSQSVVGGCSSGWLLAQWEFRGSVWI